MKDRENLKEMLFMEILIILVSQYFEVSSEEALQFVIDVMAKMDACNIKIKAK